ncbi:hypothetical protein AB6U14_15315 [Klebsiella pneumoniae]
MAFVTLHVGAGTFQL